MDRETFEIGTGRMTLFWSSRSPFVRKAMIGAHECGLAERLDLVRVQVGALVLAEEIHSFSPLNRIPALRLENGASLVGSGVICRFFAHQTGHGDLDPGPGDPSHIAVLRLEEIADSMMDFTTGRMSERGRSDPMPERLAASARKLNSGLDWLELRIGSFDPDRPDIGQIALAAALGHLVFRDAELHWQQGRPLLTAWQNRFAARKSVELTRHDLVY